MIDCINKEDALIDYAIELGLCGLAITDHESLGGHIKALQYYKKLQEKAKEDINKDDQKKKEWANKVLNFKLALGNEIYLCRDDLNKNNYIKGEDGFFHFILVAKDKIGHKQLRELSSRAWNHTFRQFMERVPTYYRDIEEIVCSNKGHLIATTACLGGQFPKLLMEAIEKNNFSKVDNFMNWCREIFEDDFYIEIQPGLSDDQVSFNSAAITYANQRGFKYVVSTDTHYLKETDRPVHKSFLNSGDGDREVDDFYAYTYMMDYDEIIQKLTTHMSKEMAIEALENTKEIYSKIEFYDLAHKQVIPRVPYHWDNICRFESAPSQYPYIEKFENSPYEDDRFFICSILTKANQLGILDEIHWQRIEDECGEIWEVSEKIEERLSAYFLTIQKVVDIGWNEGDTLMGPWRGSAGALLTAYLLDITQRDPLESPIELPYWRCISRGRAELADFDLDSQASKRERFIAAIKTFFESIGGQVISVCTYGTETSKAALLTAARGLGYEPELGTYLSSLIPIDRGFVRTLSQCYYGDEEKGYKPIKQFITEMNIHKDIWEVARGIEGLISRRGIHAAGILITNNKFTEFNATMRSPKGVLTSQWELHDSEYVGNIKFDMLTIDALDRIRTTLELLLEYGYIEWQGTLKKTYLKYIAPQVLDYDNEKMWELVGENKIISLFQFDTPVGLQCAKQIKPRSLLELAQANSLMRLMPEGTDLTPVEEFVRYKENPNLLSDEIDSLIATEGEKKELYNFLKQYNGVPDSQESIMLLVMHPKFLGFDVIQANKLRKLIAKKKIREIEEFKVYYYDVGRKNGCSEDVLRYIWDKQISRQLGYSFSIIHTIAYSTVAIQELNLAYHYPSIFWNTACLIVDSAGLVEDEDEESPSVVESIGLKNNPKDEQTEETETDDEEDEDDEEIKEEKTKKPKKVVNYGKISSAIGKMKQFGINIVPPDINRSKYTFVPDVENNQIVYGIKGITKINDELAALIIEKRPYDGIEDFMSKVKVTKLQMINLIKSGAFDAISNYPREDIMFDYIKTISGCKKKLTLQNIQMIINQGLIPEELKPLEKVYNFNKFLKKNKFEDYYILDDYSQEYFNSNFNADLLTFVDGNCCIKQKEWDKIYKKQMDGIRPFLAKPETLQQLNHNLIGDLWDKYCSGPVSKWEMDSIGFYNSNHELDGIRDEDYDIVNFFSLPEEPIPASTFTTKEGKTIPLFKLERIAGTVLEKNKLKNIITLLTKDGVVKVKIYKPQFVKYDRQIFERDLETGKKKVIEKSWFTRGNKLIISGIRREDSFSPKCYRNSPYPNAIGMIEDINYNDGSLSIIYDRKGE